jgi:hypothetical protein
MLGIFGEDGFPLAVVSPVRDGNPHVMTVGRVVAGQAVLLGYYFGKGKRNVQVSHGLVSLPGVLETTWLDDERQWRVRLVHPDIRTIRGARGPVLASASGSHAPLD